MLQAVRDYPDSGAPLGVPLTWTPGKADPDAFVMPSIRTKDRKTDRRREWSSLNYALTAAAKDANKARNERKKRQLGRDIGEAVAYMNDFQPTP